MSALVTELAGRRTAERDNLLAQYRRAIWQTARGDPQVDELDGLSRDLFFDPERVQCDVEAVEVWMKQTAKAERYETMNVAKECAKAKKRFEKAAKELQAATENSQEWRAGSVAAGSCGSSVQQIERANPELFEGCNHETA